MNILCLGDSLTYGYGVPRAQSWAALAAKKTGWTLVNAGVNGDTTGGMLARFAARADGERPDAVFVMGGANDMFAGCPAHVMQANLTAIVQQSLMRGVRPVVGIPTAIDAARLPGPWRALYQAGAQPDALDAFVRWIPTFAQAFSVDVIDFRTPFAAASERDPAAWYIDGVHPTKTGHALLAEVFAGGMQTVLGR